MLRKRELLIIVLYFLLLFPLQAEDMVYKGDVWNLMNYFRIIMP